MELRTPTRGVDRATDAGEGDPERQAAGGGDAGGGVGDCVREQSQSGSWKCAERELQMCGSCSSFTRSLTPLLLTLMGQLKVGRILQLGQILPPPN